MVLRNRHGQRRTALLPVRDQLVEPPRIDDRARKDVRPDLAAFLKDAD